jgi:hypothetical protein
MEYNAEFPDLPGDIPIDPPSPEAAEGLTNRDLEAPTRLAYFLADVVVWLKALNQARYVLYYEGVRRSLLDAFDETGPAVWERIPTIVYQELRDLEALGLTGNSLHAKLTGYSNARDRFWRRGGIKGLRHLLKWMDTILGSIAVGVPPLHALKELKDAIERVIDDTVDGYNG